MTVPMLLEILIAIVCGGFWCFMGSWASCVKLIARKMGPENPVTIYDFSKLTSLK